MISRTLALYFARDFVKIFAAFFLVSVLVLGLVSFIEYFNRAFRGDAVPGLKLALAAVLRVPSEAEEALPFTVLYGSIAAFVVANRRLEVVVARAAGISAWQFLLPACVAGLLLGVLATTVYNPAAAFMKGRSAVLFAELFTKADRPVESGGPIWVRQSARGIDSIIGAAQSLDEGLSLSGVTAYVFDPDGGFGERIDAARAHFLPGEWRLEDATITAPTGTPRHVEVHSLPTDLSPNEVKRAFLEVDSVSFWRLQDLATTARRSGVPADRYQLEFNLLLSRPILLLAIVLIAANVSLRFSRSRHLGRMIITGVAVGFMLYVVMKIARDLGIGGVVPPPVAAWLPAIVATLVGISVLLHVEDG
ncbi:MAG: LPS export ABC transporter permease LptG [Bauldia sp.]